MNPKPALWLSIGLSVFIMFFLSSIVQALAARNADAAQAVGPVAVSADVQSQIAQRDLTYRQTIEQANAQLTQAQAALAAAQGASTETAPAADYPISAEQAVQIAQGVALSGSQLAGEAELVDFEGKVAYEVPFNAGNVYVDATSGDVLFNGTINLAPSLITAEQAAQIAANYMGRSDVYGVDETQLNGITVYRVKFMNSDAVFVDQYGQIMLVRLASNGSSGSSHSGEREGEHEDNDD